MRVRAARRNGRHNRRICRGVLELLCGEFRPIRAAEGGTESQAPVSFPLQTTQLLSAVMSHTMVASFLSQIAKFRFFNSALPLCIVAEE